MAAAGLAVGISAWLFGGWGLDARIGRITREHGDIEFWVERVDAERSKAVLAGAGATALATQPPAEEQFPRLRNGRPWRQKDIDDIKILRGLAAEAGPQP